MRCEHLWHVLGHCLVQVYLKYPASNERYRRSSCGGCSKSDGNVLPKFPVHFLNSLNYRKFNYFSSDILINLHWNWIYPAGTHYTRLHWGVSVTAVVLFDRLMYFLARVIVFISWEGDGCLVKRHYKFLSNLNKWTLHLFASRCCLHHVKALSECNFLFINQANFVQL